MTYNQNAIELEAFSRPLWALVPFWVGGGSDPEFEKSTARALLPWHRPGNPEYWGTTGEYDQCYAGDALLPAASPPHRKSCGPRFLIPKNRTCRMAGADQRPHHPGLQLQFFRILVNLALKSVGMPYSPELLEDGLCKIDSYYSGDGWSTDGASVQKDYYIPWAIQAYGLLYSKFAADTDPGVLHSTASAPSCSRSSSSIGSMPTAQPCLLAGSLTLPLALPRTASGRPASGQG